MPGTLVTKIILNALNLTGASHIAQSRLSNCGSVLMLHRVEPNSKKDDFNPNAHLSVTPAFLTQLIFELAQKGFDFVSLDEAAARIQGDKSGKPFISVTLDDGYRDNLVNAVPIFRKYKVPYTIYVAPGLVDGRAKLWWEDLQHLVANNDALTLKMPSGPLQVDTGSLKQKQAAFTHLLNHLTREVSEYQQREILNQACKDYDIDCEAHRANSIMNWNELIELSSDPLCTLGAHTIHHYAVGRLSDQACKDELSQSAEEIKSQIKMRPKHFAYPYGYPEAASTRDFAIAKECGFTTAVTTRHGVCYHEHKEHMSALPRISVNGLFQKTAYVKTMLSGATTFLQNKGGKLNVS